MHSFLFQLELISARQWQPRRALTLLSDPLTIGTPSDRRRSPRALIGQRAVHFEQRLAGLPARAAVQHVLPWRCFFRCEALAAVLR